MFAKAKRFNYPEDKQETSSRQSLTPNCRRHMQRCTSCPRTTGSISATKHTPPARSKRSASLPRRVTKTCQPEKAEKNIKNDDTCQVEKNNKHTHNDKNSKIPIRCPLNRSTISRTENQNRRSLPVDNSVIKNPFTELKGRSEAPAVACLLHLIGTNDDETSESTTSTTSSSTFSSTTESSSNQLGLEVSSLDEGFQSPGRRFFASPTLESVAAIDRFYEEIATTSDDEESRDICGIKMRTVFKKISKPFRKMKRQSL